jgi:hypothetical protein
MEIERYSHVMHISSTVTGQLQPGLDSWDALRAALPAGTVSGAPKVGEGLCSCYVSVCTVLWRCMEYAVMLLSRATRRSS